MTNELEGNECVIYKRVSHARQKTEGNGLMGQETRCREYARSLGLTVIATFEDDMTGRVASRNGMNEMRSYLKENKGRKLTIIWDSVSRLARDRRA